jgi:cysteine synthase A
VLSWFETVTYEMFSLSNIWCLDRWIPFPNTRQLVWGVILGFSLSLATSSILSHSPSRRRQNRRSSPDARTIGHTHDIVTGVAGLIGMAFPALDPFSFVIPCVGNTPLVRINSLSDALGVEILGKAEVRESR